MGRERKKVVVTGMGLVSCLGNEPAVFYEKLLQGQSGIGPIERISVAELPVKFAGNVPSFDPGELIDKKLARRADPFILYAMYAAKRAMLDAHLAIDGSDIIDKAKAGVIIGSGIGGLHTFAENQTVYLEKGYRRVSPFLIPFLITNMPGGLIAQDLGFMGPNYSISTACATSNYCFMAAARHIQSGEADVMLAGGVEAPLIPLAIAGFSAAKALSDRNDEPQRASRPWDKHRNGFVMAEGSCVLVLESEEHAKRRGATILAELCGGGMSCDAYHMTDPHPEGLGVALTLKNALADAGITEHDVDYINAHATSTMVGDLAELRALERVFSRPESIFINATKSMIGHSLGAAGAMEACAAIMAIQSGWIHPTINLEDPEPIRFHVPLKKEQKSIRYAISNSFGFGGHNSTIVLGKYAG